MPLQTCEHDTELDHARVYCVWSGKDVLSEEIPGAGGGSMGRSLWRATIILAATTNAHSQGAQCANMWRGALSMQRSWSAAMRAATPMSLHLQTLPLLRNFSKRRAQVTLKMNSCPAIILTCEYRLMYQLDSWEAYGKSSLIAAYVLDTVMNAHVLDWLSQSHRWDPCSCIKRAWWLHLHCKWWQSFSYISCLSASATAFSQGFGKHYCRWSFFARAWHRSSEGCEALCWPPWHRCTARKEWRHWEPCQSEYCKQLFW